MKIASKLFLSAALCISSFPLMAMDPQEGDKGNAVPHLAPSVTISQVPQQGSNNGQQSLRI